MNGPIYGWELDQFGWAAVDSSGRRKARHYPRCEFREITADDVARMRPVPPAVLDAVEAALIDGSSSFGILTRILFPLSGPALMTLVIVNSLWVWNDLLIALVLLPEDEMRPLMVGITIFGSRYSSDVPVAMAGMLMASLPMLLLYLFGQRYFIRGIVAGALKG